MPSFEMHYAEEDDLLEVTFAAYEESFCRTVPLNDHIFVHTDLGLGAVWGITFCSFSRLLGVSETELTSLAELSEAQAGAILGLLARPPASHFFDVTDTSGLLARIRTPRVEDLVKEQRTARLASPAAASRGGRVPRPGGRCQAESGPAGAGRPQED